MACVSSQLMVKARGLLLSHVLLLCSGGTFKCSPLCANQLETSKFKHALDSKSTRIHNLPLLPKCTKACNLDEDHFPTRTAAAATHAFQISLIPPTMEESLPCVSHNAPFKCGNWRSKTFNSPLALTRTRGSGVAYDTKRLTLLHLLGKKEKKKKKEANNRFLGNNVRVIRQHLLKIHHLHSLVQTYRLLALFRSFL